MHNQSQKRVYCLEGYLAIVIKTYFFFNLRLKEPQYDNLRSSRFLSFSRRRDQTKQAGERRSEPGVSKKNG